MSPILKVARWPIKKSFLLIFKQLLLFSKQTDLSPTATQV